MNPFERLTYTLAYAACRAYLDAKLDHENEVKIAQPADAGWRDRLRNRMRKYADGAGVAGGAGAG